jgi:hypothetical protein
VSFNRRKMEDQRRQAAEKEAARRRATDAQVLEDAERLIAAWNERQALRAPMIFSPTIGADRHSDAAVPSLIPALSCRSCRPNAPFAETRAPIANEHRRRNARGASSASAWGIAPRGRLALASRSEGGIIP